MAYIGRSVDIGMFEKQVLTPNSSTTTFTLNFGVGSANSLLVVYGGVIQEPNVAYSVSGGGQQIVFSEAPVTGTTLYIIYLGKQLLTARTAGQETTKQSFTGDGTTTLFTLNDAPVVPAGIMVFVDGILQREGVGGNYVAGGSTINFDGAPDNGAEIDVYTLVKEKASIDTVLDGSITLAKLAAGHPSWNSAGNTTISGTATIAGATTISGITTIDVDSSNTALRVTQRGSGEALRVEDSANPDSTPFVVMGDGRVGLNTVPNAGWNSVNNVMSVLQFGSGGAVGSWNGGTHRGVSLYNNYYDNGNSQQFRMFEGPASAISVNTGNLVFSTAGTGAANSLLTLVDRFTVDNGGNTYVNGNSTNGAITGTNVHINTPTSNASKINFQVNGTSTGFVYNNATETAIGAPQGGELKLQIANLGYTAARIDQNGTFYTRNRMIVGSGMPGENSYAYYSPFSVTLPIYTYAWGNPTNYSNYAARLFRFTNLTNSGQGRVVATIYSRGDYNYSYMVAETHLDIAQWNNTPGSYEFWAREISGMTDVRFAMDSSGYIWYHFPQLWSQSHVMVINYMDGDTQLDISNTTYHDSTLNWKLVAAGTQTNTETTWGN